MIRVFIVLFFISLLSCTSNQFKKQNNFINIDISRSDGWYSFYSMNIDSSGFFLFKKTDNKKTEKYFKGKLSDSSIYNILVLIDSINIANYDTLYESNCCDCPFYKIIINKKKGLFKSTVHGRHDLVYLDSIINLFTGIEKSNNYCEVDTAFQFESFINFLPLVLEPVKFMPPIVNE